MTQVMEVATWDGRTKYKMEESKEEEAKRLEEWENYLKEGGDDKKPLEAPWEEDNIGPTFLTYVFSDLNNVMWEPGEAERISCAMGRKELMGKIKAEGRQTKKELKVNLKGSIQLAFVLYLNKSTRFDASYS